MRKLHLQAASSATLAIALALALPPLTATLAAQEPPSPSLSPTLDTDDVDANLVGQLQELGVAVGSVFDSTFGSVPVHGSERVALFTRVVQEYAAALDAESRRVAFNFPLSDAEMVGLLRGIDQARAVVEAGSHRFLMNDEEFVASTGKSDADLWRLCLERYFELWVLRPLLQLAGSRGTSPAAADPPESPARQSAGPEVIVDHPQSRLDLARLSQERLLAVLLSHVPLWCDADDRHREGSGTVMFDVRTDVELRFPPFTQVVIHARLVSTPEWRLIYVPVVETNDGRTLQEEHLARLAFLYSRQTQELSVLHVDGVRSRVWPRLSVSRENARILHLHHGYNYGDILECHRLFDAIEPLRSAEPTLDSQSSKSGSLRTLNDVMWSSGVTFHCAPHGMSEAEYASAPKALPSVLGFDVAAVRPQTRIALENSNLAVSLGIEWEIFPQGYHGQTLTSASDAGRAVVSQVTFTAPDRLDGRTVVFQRIVRLQPADPRSSGSFVGVLDALAGFEGFDLEQRWGDYLGISAEPVADPAQLYEILLQLDRLEGRPALPSSSLLEVDDLRLGVLRRLGLTASARVVRDRQRERLERGGFPSDLRTGYARFCQDLDEIGNLGSRQSFPSDRPASYFENEIRQNGLPPQIETSSTHTTAEAPASSKAPPGLLQSLDLHGLSSARQSILHGLLAEAWAHCRPPRLPDAAAREVICDAYVSLSDRLMGASDYEFLQLAANLEWRVCHALTAPASANNAPDVARHQWENLLAVISRELDRCREASRFNVEIQRAASRELAAVGRAYAESASLPMLRLPLSKPSFDELLDRFSARARREIGGMSARIRYRASRDDIRAREALRHQSRTVDFLRNHAAAWVEADASATIAGLCGRAICEFANDARALRLSDPELFPCRTPIQVGVGYSTGGRLDMALEVAVVEVGPTDP